MQAQSSDRLMVVLRLTFVVLMCMVCLVRLALPLMTAMNVRALPSGSATFVIVMLLRLSNMLLTVIV